MDPIVIVVAVIVVLAVAGAAFFMMRRKEAPQPRLSMSSDDRTYVGIGTPPARPSAQPRSDATMVGPAPTAPRADATVVGPVPSAPGGERTVVDVRVPASPAPSSQTASSAPTVPSVPERLDVTAPTIKVPARPRMRLSVTKGGSGLPIELDEREYTIGRSSRSDVVLEDPSVSGQHAKLVPHPLGFTVTDLGSTNGTKVNGKPVQGEQALHAGDTIGIGDAVLRYERLA